MSTSRLLRGEKKVSLEVYHRVWSVGRLIFFTEGGQLMKEFETSVACWPWRIDSRNFDRGPTNSSYWLNHVDAINLGIQSGSNWFEAGSTV